MKTRYQIFISSTYEDLKEERQKVMEVILNMGHFPIGMELFDADDEEQWVQIRQAIDDSDIYILILGQRYGSITKNNISYTEKEYNYAKSRNMPILSFIINDDVPLKKGSYDLNEKAQKLEKFKSRVKKKSCAFWSDKNELGLKVSQALQKKISNINTLGWVKIGDKLNSNISNGIEEYFYVGIERLIETLKKQIYIENFERYINVEFVDNNKNIKVTTLTNIVFKNVKNKTYYYRPCPVFKKERDLDSYKHLIFEINGNDEIQNIKTTKQIRSKSLQLRYCAVNDINYSTYINDNDIYIRHKTEHILHDGCFFQFYQLQYPCKKLSVHCCLDNNKDKYSFICSASSSYRASKNKGHRREIEQDDSRSEIIFGDWSDIGDGFTITLNKK